MAIRETLQKHAAAAAVAVSIMAAICVAVIFLELKGQAQTGLSTAGKVFYSDDDGKTWFLDDMQKGSPIDHNGKPAYRAMVYRCIGGGEPFVGFLAKFSDQQIAQMASDPRVLGLPMQDLKKPGGSTWGKNTATFSGSVYPPVPCPSGGGNAVMVFPNDLDSGATR